jgi:hypothetical protein
MSLRDYLAAAALTGITAANESGFTDLAAEKGMKVGALMAQTAYKLADFMLTAREPKQPDADTPIAKSDIELQTAADMAVPLCQEMVFNVEAGIEEVCGKPQAPHPTIPGKFIGCCNSCLPF